MIEIKIKFACHDAMLQSFKSDAFDSCLRDLKKELVSTLIIGLQQNMTTFNDFPLGHILPAAEEASHRYLKWFSLADLCIIWQSHLVNSSIPQ